MQATCLCFKMALIEKMRFSSQWHFKFISFLLFIQIRAELEKILQEPDITKVIRERFQGGWRERLLTVLSQSKNKDIMELMEEAEGLDINDENGEFTHRKLECVY